MTSPLVFISWQYIKKQSKDIQFSCFQQLSGSSFLIQAPVPLLSLCGLLWAQSPPCSLPVAPLPMRSGPKRSLLKSGLKRSLWMWRCTPQPWLTCPLLLCLITRCSPLPCLTPCLPLRKCGSVPFQVSLACFLYC